MTTQNPPRAMPPMPVIGKPESYYAHHVHDADRRGDHHAREAFKVGQYITLALGAHLTWEQKLRYFQHALKRHCVPPPYPDDEIWSFYSELAQFVRRHAGEEALRLASFEDDLYVARIENGQSRELIEDEAEVFFARLLPEACPDWFVREEYVQLKLIRDQWL